jgi:hypothetical protein
MPEKPRNENVQLPCGQDEKTNAIGSPTWLPISSLYLEFARKALPEELRMELDLANGAIYGEGLAKAMFDAAIKEKNVSAAREIRESIEGRAAQRRNPEGPQKFELVVTYESPLLKMVPKDNQDAPHEEIF